MYKCATTTLLIMLMGFALCYGLVLRFKYTTKFSMPKIACPAIVYAEIVVVIDPFFVGVCPWMKVYRYNPTEICQQRLQGVRNVAQKLCSWERSFTVIKVCNHVIVVYSENKLQHYATAYRNHKSADEKLGLFRFCKFFLCTFFQQIHYSLFRNHFFTE